MDIYTIDLETFYSKDYSLSKLTTEAYVRSREFETIMMGMRLPNGESYITHGKAVQYELDKYDFSDAAILHHNALFDASILSWHYGVSPKAWLDTLCMARAMHGLKGNSLAALAIKYNLGNKGDEVVNMMGRRRDSLTTEEFNRYAAYCLKDVQLTWDLFVLMSQGWYNLDTMDIRHPFPLEEYKLIDVILRMFTEPMLRLNPEKLKAHLAAVQARKAALLARCGMDKGDLMSNPKFAELLTSFGIDPPMKVSPTTGKKTYAFAKTDAGLRELLEHPDERVQAIVAARMGVKSTLEETRTERFLEICSRNPLFPVPIKYAAARTHRLGGTDKINLQNLSARGSVDAGKLKDAIEAPEDHVIIDCDSSQIEARVLAWLAEQEDLVNDFRNKVDIYSKMATRIYGRVIDRKRKVVVDGVETKPDEREGFVGKTVILGAGYGTGALKLQITLKNATPSIELPEDECQRIIKTYRNTYPQIPRLWRQGEQALQAIHDNNSMWFGRAGVVLIEGNRGVKLPNGLYISYPSLHKKKDADGKDKWWYKDETGIQKIHGAKLVENVVQALARIIVMQQMLRISKKLTVTLPVHDAVASIAHKSETKEAREYHEACMRWVPKWAEGCPIDCESGVGLTYGEC